MKNYRKERFESRDSCLIWVADNKPIYNSTGELSYESEHFKINTVLQLWQEWHKAIEIVPEKRIIEVWVNIFKDGLMLTYNHFDEAKRSGDNCIGTIKLSKEITIIDGKVVEDEN